MRESKYLRDNAENIRKLMAIPMLKDFEVENLSGLLKVSKIREYAHGERIIEEVGRSIADLGKILAELQNLQGDETAPSGLVKIREELDQTLAVARSVDEQMKTLDKSLDLAELN